MDVLLSAGTLGVLYRRGSKRSMIRMLGSPLTLRCPIGQRRCRFDVGIYCARRS